MKCQKCKKGELDATTHEDYSDKENSIEVRLTCDNEKCGFSAYTFIKREYFVESEYPLES